MTDEAKGLACTHEPVGRDARKATLAAVGPDDAATGTAQLLVGKRRGSRPALDFDPSGKSLVVTAVDPGYAYRRSLAADAEQADVHRYLANLLAAHGREDEAAPHWRESLRLAPDRREAAALRRRLAGG